MEEMMNDIEALFVFRKNIYNALNIVVKTIESGVDLELPALYILRGIANKRRDQAMFAFRVMNELCGGSLPAPAFATEEGEEGEENPSPSAPEPASRKEGEKEYCDVHVSMAADLSRAIDALHNDIIGLCGRASLTSRYRGSPSRSLVPAIISMYTTKRIARQNKEKEEGEDDTRQ